jgi:hypothetical protein
VSFYDWHSKNTLARTSIPHEDLRQWSVVKYRSGIRKQACLVISDGHSQRPVAYFKSEADARQFAVDLFGGINDQELP